MVSVPVPMVAVPPVAASTILSTQFPPTFTSAKAVLSTTLVPALLEAA